MRERAVIIGIAVMLLLMGGWTFVTLRRIAENRDRIVSLQERSMGEALDVERLAVYSERSARIVRGYLLAPEAESLAQLAQVRVESAAALRRVGAAYGATPLLRRLQAVEEAQLRVRRIAESLIAARSAGAPLEEVQQRFEQELLPARRELDATINALGVELRAQLKQDQRDAAHLLDRSVRLFGLSLVSSLAVLLVLLALLARMLAQQRRREHALRLSEAKFAGIVSIAADAIISIDARQRITIFNAGAEHIFGYTAAEVLGKPVDMLLPERFAGRHAHHLKAFSGGPTLARHMGERRDLQGRRKNGEEFPADAAISKLDVEGSPVMTVVLRDVSERRRAEHEQHFLATASAVLAESLDPAVTLEGVARLVVPELADCCIIHLVREAHLVMATVAHADTGAAATLREALARGPIPLESSHVIAQAARTRAPRLLEHLPEQTLQELGQGGESLPLLGQLGFRSLVCVPLRVRDRCIGAITLMMGTSGRPLGERQRVLAEELARRAALAIDNASLYAEAQRATRSRDEMLGIVAHDLRSPVNAMVLSANVILRRLRKQGADAELILSAEGIIQSTRRMNRLIEDLLDVVRLEAGRLSIHRSNWPAAQLVCDAVEAQRPLFAEARLEVRLELPDTLPTVLVDADRILQVFTNLMGNAIKFTPPGGVVTVGASLEEGGVVFRVADSGPGIPPEHLPHLFDRFWQARHNDRRGAGLGLTISKGIIDAHGGRIWAQSVAGQGSTFFFSLPLPSAH